MTNKQVKDWQDSVIIGSIIGGGILIGIILMFKPQIQQLESTNNRDNSNSSSVSSTTKIQSSSLSEQEAVNIIKKLLEYKKRIFAPPYDKTLGAEILAGKYYHDSIQRTDGKESSVEWLQNNNAYYTYDLQEVNSVEKFHSGNNEANIDIVITEKRTLYNKNGGIDHNASGFDQRVVRYYLQFENGVWKIKDHDTIKTLWKK